MKQTYLLVVLFLVVGLSSCSKRGDRDEILGVSAKSVKSEVPYGMVYIPSGSYLMGQTDQDITFAQISQTKQVTIPAFFMDQTEITNSQYRQFVNWVRDSIAITQYLSDPKYYYTPKGAAAANVTGPKYINWDYVKKNPVFRAGKKGQAGNTAKLQSMYYQGDDRVFDRNELDVRLLKYNLEIKDQRAAANNKNDKTKKRSDFILRDTIAIYPDTLVWLSDFSYAANEPMVEGYFSHHHTVTTRL
jgi:formylglycine-generating enzyme